MKKQFAVMWDCLGLEACRSVPTMADRTWAALAKTEITFPQILHWRLRAQFNPQRHYEIWFVEAVDGIDEDDIVDMFNSSPQTAADTIRKLGQCYYSDRAEPQKVLIT